MKKLKIILQHNIIYYVFLFICLVFYFVFNNLDYVSVYDKFVNEEFVITSIVKKNYGIKLELKGKEKVLGNMYVDEEEALNFLDEYLVGDKVLVNGDVSFTCNNTVPDTFNYKKYLYSNKIYNVVKITSISKTDDNSNIFYFVKNILVKRGEKLKKSSPYINSLIFGNNSYLDDDVMLSYRENGVSHLFAISGMHISMFILFLNFFLNRFRLNEIVKSFILIFFLIFYMFLTNFSMSVLRGGIFTILLILNKIFKLEIKSLNLLILGLCVILILNPLNLNNVGLIYSFVVTFCLIYFSSYIKGGYFSKLFIISFMAFLVSYPITINNFNQVNLFSILYNIFFVPYVSLLLLPLIFFGYLFPFLDNVIFFFVNIIELVSHFLAGIEIGKISMCKMGVLMIVSYYVIIFNFFKCKRERKFWWSFILLVFLFFHYFMPFKRDDYVMFLDVGQGDSIFLSVNDTFTLIDTGGVIMYDGKEYTYKLSKNLLFPYFKSNGIRKIDNLVLTHGDADHMKEAYYIVDNFNVKRVYLNSNKMNYEEAKIYELCKLKGIDIIFLKKDDLIDVGGYYLKSLNGSYENENDSSIILYGVIKNYSFVFTGDAPLNVEKEVFNEYAIRDIDVLKVGHHGSKTSLDDELVKMISPKYSVISVGRNNRFGHPNKEVLDCLRGYNVYRTDEDGSVMFKLMEDKFKIKNFAP